MNKYPDLVPEHASLIILDQMCKWTIMVKTPNKSDTFLESYIFKEMVKSGSAQNNMLWRISAIGKYWNLEC